MKLSKKQFEKFFKNEVKILTKDEVKKNRSNKYKPIF